MALTLLKAWGGKFRDWGGLFYSGKHPSAGVIGDGTTDDRAALSALDTAALVSGAMAVLGPRDSAAATIKVATDITIQSPLKIYPGAKLKPSSGKVITLNGPVHAGLYQIFDLSAGGTVVFGDHVIQEVPPEWWGAKADDSTDNATPWSQWAAALGSGSGQPAKSSGVLARGIYQLGDTFHVEDLRGLKIKGRGPWVTRIKWVGDDSSDAILLESCMDCTLGGFSIENASGVDLACALRLIQGSGSSYASSRNTVRRVGVGGVGDLLVDAFIVGGAGTDANNDFAIFERCTAEDYTGAGFGVGSSQSFDVTCIDCYARASGTATAAAGMLHAAGNYRWIRGFMGNNAVDFKSTGDSNGGAIVIEGLNSEGAERLLQTAGPSGAYFSVSIRDTRWASDNLHADGKAIIFQFPGPLTIEGGKIGTSTAKAMKFEYNPGTDEDFGQFDLRNVTVVSSATTMAGLFNAYKPTSWDFRLEHASDIVRMRDRWAVTLTIDIPSLTAGTTTQTTHTVDGVETYDCVKVVPKGSLDAGVVVAWARGDTTDTIRICWGNITGSPIDPSSQDFDIHVEKKRHT
ncbi:MAG: hypothetical protein AB7I13_00385 [Vicinamibacterales bacterium]